MRGPKPGALTLNDAERNELEVLIHRHRAPNNWRCEDESTWLLLSFLMDACSLLPSVPHVAFFLRRNFG